jgi:WD40 repeat protein
MSIPPPVFRFGADPNATDTSTSFVPAHNVVEAMALDTGAERYWTRVWNLLQGARKDASNLLSSLPFDLVNELAEYLVLQRWSEEGASLRLVHTLIGHTNTVCCLSILNHSRVVSSSFDSTIRIWNIEEGKEERKLQGHTSLVRALFCLSTDPPRLASGSHDRKIKIWDYSDGTCLQALDQHQGEITILRMLPVSVCKTGLVSASEDRTARTWNYETGECLTVFKGHTTVVYSVEVVHDDKLLTEAADHTVRLWELRTGVCLRVINHTGSTPHGVAVLWPLLASTDESHNLRILDLTNGETVASMPGHTQGIRGLYAIRSKRLFASRSDDHTVRVWDADQHKCVHTLEGHSCLSRLVLQTQDVLMSGGSQDGQVIMWDYNSGKTLRKVKAHIQGIRNMRYLRDVLVTASFDSTIRIWHLC